MVRRFKRLGIVGGLGPETSSKFYLALNFKFRKLKGIQPNLVLENVPVSKSIEESIIHGRNSCAYLSLLKKAIQHLQRSKVDFIVIPCNSVHVFIEDLRKISSIPILSIIEETARRCQEFGVKKIGLFASQETVNKGLFDNVFKKSEIQVITPQDRDQITINQIIIKIIEQKLTPTDKQQLQQIIIELQNQGSDAIILGCTDLSLVANSLVCKIPVFDTCKILEDACIRNMI